MTEIHKPQRDTRPRDVIYILALCIVAVASFVGYALAGAPALVR